MTNVHGLRSLASHKLALRVSRLAAVAILAVVVDIGGNGVDVRTRATEMNSCQSGPASCCYPPSVIRSNLTTNLATRYIWRETSEVEDVILSAIDRVADGFRVSDRVDRNERLNRMYRIARIGRVLSLDKIYSASIRFVSRKIAYPIEHGFERVPQGQAAAVGIPLCR
jgi:hypothetical protein